MKDFKTISVNGFWKDDKSEFENYLISESHDIKEDENEDDLIFFYGLSEEDIKKDLGKETGQDFVITSYEIV